MGFSELSAEQQRFLVSYLGYTPTPDSANREGLDAETPQPGAFQIFVRTGEGKTIALEVSGDMSVVDLFDTFCSKAGYSSDIDGYLSTGTKVLGARGSVADLGIANHSTLTFNLRLRGGGSDKDEKKGKTSGGGSDKKEPANSSTISEKNEKGALFKVPPRTGESLVDGELSKKTSDLAHKAVKEASEDASKRADGEKRRMERLKADASVISEGEAKWKLSEADARKSLEKVNVGDKDKFLHEMGFANGVIAVRVPPIDDIKLVSNKAYREFEAEKKREMLEKLKKSYKTDSAKTSNSSTVPSETAMLAMVEAEYQQLMSKKGGGEGQRKAYVDKATKKAKADKEWLKSQMENPTITKSMIIKEIDGKLKDNPCLLAVESSRKLPRLKKDAGYQQNCITDVLNMDTGFNKDLLETIISKADLRPSGTHGNQEKKLPSKRDPFGQESDNDLYVEYGVGGGGGLRLVQNLETGDLYLSAHYAHFYLIEEKGAPPESAQGALQMQRLGLLDLQAKEVARFFEVKLAENVIEISGFEKKKLGSFCKTAHRAISKFHNELLELKKDSVKNASAIFLFQQKMMENYITTIHPVISSKMYLLEAESAGDRDPFLVALPKFLTIYESSLVAQRDLLDLVNSEKAPKKLQDVPDQLKTEYYQLLQASLEDEEVAQFLKEIYNAAGLSEDQGYVAFNHGKNWYDAPRDGNCLFHCLERAGLGKADELRAKLAKAFRPVSSDTAKDGDQAAQGVFLPEIGDDREEIAEAIAQDGNYLGEAAFMADYVAMFLGIKITVVEEDGSMRNLGMGGKEIFLARAHNHFYLLE